MIGGGAGAGGNVLRFVPRPGETQYDIRGAVWRPGRLDGCVVLTRVAPDASRTANRVVPGRQSMSIVYGAAADTPNGPKPSRVRLRHVTQLPGAVSSG